MKENGDPIFLKNASGYLTIRNQGDTGDIIYKPPNILRGITPVASGWDTAPTNLVNVTDGDVATVTGTGSTNMGALGDYGYLVFDLGSVKTVMVGGRVGVWSAANYIKVMVAGSDDNSNWRDDTGTQYGVNSAVFEQKATEVVADMLPVILNARYIRVRFYVSGAANTANAKIYEIWAHEVGL